MDAQSAHEPGQVDWSEVDPDLLACVFAKLPFRLMGRVSLVCRLWARVAAEPSWKPEVVVYAWGDAHVTGLAARCPRPQLLEFSLATPIVQLACANEATLALSVGGSVWQWGVWCLPPVDGALLVHAQPTRVRGLRGIAQVACSPPGYFHSRSHYPFLYHCAAVGRDGSLHTWGNADTGQLCAQPGGEGAGLADEDVPFVAAQAADLAHVSWVQLPMRVREFGPPEPQGGSGGEPQPAPPARAGLEGGGVVRRVLQAACGLHMSVLLVQTQRLLPADEEGGEEGEEEAEAEGAPGLQREPSGLSRSGSSELSGSGESERRMSGSPGSPDALATPPEGSSGGEGEEASWADGEEGEEEEEEEEEEEMLFEDELDFLSAQPALPQRPLSQRRAFAAHALRKELRAAARQQHSRQAAGAAAGAGAAGEAGDGREGLRALLGAPVRLRLGGELRTVWPTSSRRARSWRALLASGLLPEGGALLGPCGSVLSLSAGGLLCTATSVESCGAWCSERPHGLSAWAELGGLPLAQQGLVCGAFHCAALTQAGRLYTFGDQTGKDRSNGNLLGTQALGALGRGVRPPRRVRIAEPIAEVAASTYCSVAVTASGRLLSWGDSDGGALGHGRRRCHTPARLRGLAGLRVRHASTAYTNGAASTEEGRVFVWGGQQWEGGIAAEGGAGGMPAEVRWAGVPGCYRCDAVALAHRHGYLLFRKQQRGGDVS